MSADISLARKFAILSFLAHHGPITLGELAHQFALKPAEIHRELRELFVVELDRSSGFESVFDVSFDLDSNDPDSFVEFISAEVEPSANLTLGELFSTLAIIDVLVVSADSDARADLLRLRERLTAAAAESGYGSFLWSMPALVRDSDLVAELGHAIVERKFVRLTYWKSGERSPNATTVDVAPVAIVADEAPLLRAALTDGTQRKYRIDRISRIELLNETFSGRFAARAKREASASFGPHVALTTDTSARWVGESIPTARVTTRGKELLIDLEARSEWLTSLLMRLGTSVHSVSVEDVPARESMVTRVRTLRKFYEESND